jgi:hypothetical protein
MEHTKELLAVGWKWLNANASDKVGFCSDRSCIRCRLADILFELEKRNPLPAQPEAADDARGQREESCEILSRHK